MNYQNIFSRVIFCTIFCFAFILPQYSEGAVGDITTYNYTGYGQSGTIFDGTNIWTADSQGGQTINKISQSGTVTRYPSGMMSMIAFDNNNLWITPYWGGSDLLEKRSLSGVSMGTYPTGGNDIAFDGVNMWLTNPYAFSVDKVSPAGFITHYEEPTYMFLPDRIAFDGVNMWATDLYGWSVSKISPTGVYTRYDVPSTALAFDGVNMWVAAYDGVRKISPLGNITTIALGFYATDIAFDGVNMWVTDHTDNSVRRITPTGTVTRFSPVASLPWNIAFDGVNMWAASINSPAISKIVAIETGTVAVTANIAGASWTISGPPGGIDFVTLLPNNSPLTGSGLSASYTARRTGTYSIVWNPVAGYVTPPPQSLVLTAGNTITFNGNYTPIAAPDLTAGLVTPNTILVNTPTIFSSTISNIGSESTSAFGGSCLQLTISSNINNYNIRTAADAAGWTTGQPVCVTINPGVTVGSVSVAQPAMTTGAFPISTSVAITNNGLIVGKGGAGGAGAGYAALPNLLPATNGEQGGAALSIAMDIFLDNSNGNIYGGGGGGGGGGALVANFGRFFTGGGGGGGAGGGAGGLMRGVLHSVCKTSTNGYAGGAVGGNGGNGCTFDVTTPPGTAGGTGGGTGVNGTFPGISNGSTGPSSAGSGGGGGGGGYGASGGNGGYFNNGVTVGSAGGTGGAPGPAIIYNGFATNPLVIRFSNFFQIATAPGGGGTVTDLPASPMDPLGASATGVATTSYTFVTAGTYSMRACADGTTRLGGGVVTESNETNNCGPWTDIIVSPPIPLCTGPIPSDSTMCVGDDTGLGANTPRTLLTTPSCTATKCEYYCSPGWEYSGGTCVRTQCNDGIDNADAEDVLIDMADPGCAAIFDTDETNAPLPPVLTATKTVVDPVAGSVPVDLQWDTNNGNEALCILSGGTLASTPTNPTAGDVERGTVTVNITARTTYTLTCPNGIDTTTIEIIPRGTET